MQLLISVELSSEFVVLVASHTVLHDLRLRCLPSFASLSPTSDACIHLTTSKLPSCHFVIFLEGVCLFSSPSAAVHVLFHCAPADEMTTAKCHFTGVAPGDRSSACEFSHRLLWSSSSSG